MNLNDRENKMMVATTVFVVGYVFYFFLFGPKLEEIGSTRAQLNKAKSQLKVDEAKVRILKTLEKKPVGISQKTLSREQWTLRILSDLSKASSRAGLDLIQIKPNAGEGHNIPFNLLSTGYYQSLYDFLKILPTLSVDVVVKSLDIKGGGTSKALLNIDMNLEAHY